MGVRPNKKRLGLGNKGQSIVEFLLTLPILMGLTIVLVRVNSAIQVSINNQQYARAHALWLTFNSPVYPQVSHRIDNFPASHGINRMIIGVSENKSEKESGSGSYTPIASTQIVTRNKKLSGGAGPAHEEPDKRGEVRIRTTVALCTQSNAIKGQGKDWAEVTSRFMGEPFNPQAFAYCRSPLDE